MGPQHFGNLLTNGHKRVKRRHGLLKNHGNVSPTYFSKLVIRQRQQIHRLLGWRIKQRLPLRRGVVGKAQQTQSRDRFARTRLANQGDFFPSAYLKTQVAHHRIGAKGNRQVVDL